MKKLLIPIVLTISMWSLKAQEMQTFTEFIDSTFKYVNRTDARTGILYERVLSFAGLTRFNSKISSVDTSDFERFKQGYHELYMASFVPSSLPYSVDSLEKIIKTRTNSIDIGFIHYKFNTMDTNVMRQKLVMGLDSTIREDSTVLASLYSENIVFIASPFAKTINSLTVNFTIGSSFYYDNTSNPITQLDIDFDDGLGFRTVAFNNTISTSYSQVGEKTMRFRAILTNGDSLMAYSKITINLVPQYANKPSNHPYYDILTINAQIAHPNNYSSGYFGKNIGYVKIYYKNADKKLRKPILIVDGFDPNNCRKIETYEDPDDEDAKGYSIWELLYYKEGKDSVHLSKILIDELGYDLVILDFPKGGDTIEKNAMVCIETINEINRRLIVSGSNEEIVIIGPSMGGQITRYALAYMEKHPNANTNYGKHNCRLWVSFDSPHQGANISIGAQAFLCHFQTFSNAWKNTLNCPAAQQMLIYHKANVKNMYNTYYSNLRSMGYPQSLRKIAVSNGSLNNISNGNANQLAVKVVYPWVIANIESKIWLSPSYGDKHIVFQTWDVVIPAIINPNWAIPIILYCTWTVTAPNNYCSIDAAPGCYYNTFEQVKDKTKGSITNIYLKNHCFMPTTSVLDITGNYDYCTDFSNRDLVTEGKVPFNSYWGPIDKNMQHITFDKDLANYLINEIETYITGKKTINFCDIQEYTAHLPAGKENARVTWYCSDNLKIVSGRYSQIVQIQAIGKGDAWIYAEADNLTHSKRLPKYYIKINGTNTYTNAPALTSSNNQWNKPYQLLEPLTIPNGKTLTISSTLYCSPAAAIIVQPGGKLIIDGGILTSICDNDLWQGIQVLGHPLLTQSLDNNDQGILILKNHAVIENAECAVSVGLRVLLCINNKGQILDISETSLFSSFGGGIISATDASFINNRLAISLQNYIHTNSNNFESDNKSTFVNCSFIVNNDALFSGTNNNFQVFLCNVKGVTFNGCNFEDSKTKSSLNEFGMGIYSYNAGICLNDKRIYSIPPYYPTPCSFKGFSTAIVVKNAGTRPVHIYNTTFEQNQTSINAISSYALIMQMCDIYNSSSQGFFPSLYGLILNKCDGYRIYNNTFHGNGTGILFLGDVLSDNEIHNNTFHDMCIACCVNGMHGCDNSNIPSIGVVFNCNVFDNNDQDILIEDNGGINPLQGEYSSKHSTYYGAGNQFGDPNISIMNINNLNSYFKLWYYYNSNGHNHYPVNCYNVFSAVACMYDPNQNVFIGGTNSDKCHNSGYVGQSYYNEMNFVSVDELNDLYINTYEVYNETKAEYLGKYETSNISDVIRDNGGLPSVPGIVPQFDMLADLTSLKYSLTTICQSAIQVLLIDEDLDKIQYNSWLSRCETIDADYVLAESYFSEGNILKMNKILDSISIKYPNSDKVENDQYKTCMNYLVQWTNAINSINTADGTSNMNDSLFISKGAFDTLETIAQGENRAAFKAQSMLETFKNQFIPSWENDRCRWLARTGNYINQKSNTTTTIEEKTKISKQNLLLIPNPASDIITIDCENTLMKEIYMYDVVGKEVKHFSINESNTTIFINDLVPGAYLIKVKTENGIKTKKFIKE